MRSQWWGGGFGGGVLKLECILRLWSAERGKDRRREQDRTGSDIGGWSGRGG